jgi:mannose-6-phosphate isomerase-like protein (cupin superfamily)
MKSLASGRIACAQTILKPWGYEKIFAHTEKYAGKILHINPGHRLSKQYHEIKDETIFILSGVLRLYVNDVEIAHVMSEGQCIRLYPNTIHRFEAPDSGDAVILLEVSTSELDDVVRIEDDYDRK